MYLMRVVIDKGELDAILADLEQAKRTIYSCYSRLEELGVLHIEEKEDAASGN